MRKRVGIIKRVLCIGLIFLLSINSFAAIVSDNDGSAFITKAEFDALKSNFQSQIDTYNQSIDSKIDGAIASYLSGIRIAKTQMINTLEDYSGGARSIVADEWTLGTAGSYKPGGMNWSHGYLGMNCAAQETVVKNDNIDYSDSTTQLEFCTFINKFGRAATDFKERIIKNYDETSGQASWHGYCTTNQNVEGSTYKVVNKDTVPHFREAWRHEGGTESYGTGTEADPYKLAFIVFNFYQEPDGSSDWAKCVNDDRTPLKEKVEPIMKWYVYGKNVNGSWAGKDSVYRNNYINNQEYIFEVNANGLSYTRTIKDTKEKYLILCNNDTEYKVRRLSDMDLISGWTNERDVAFSTGITKVYRVGSWLTTYDLTFIGLPENLIKANRYPIWAANESKSQVYLNAGDTNKVWITWDARQQNGLRSGYKTDFPMAQLPYFGFMNQVSDWRKISDGNYGSLVNIADIKFNQKEGESTTLLNHDGTELMIGAGLPVIKLEKDKEYKFKMKIDTGSAPNETGDYYIWFKDGSFTNGKKPQNESNLYEVTGISKDATGYIMPKGAEKEITIKATQNGYLFCKWRCKALNGGGILYIDKEVACTSE